MCSDSTKAVIAIVEDEAALRANYELALHKAGFNVRTYANLADARTMLDDNLPELVIIDVGLGDDPEGGFELCRSLRATSATLPIVFLTARDSEMDVISGLRLGADEYLSKEISLAQLTVRVIALLKRTEARMDVEQQSAQRVVGQLSIDADCIRAMWAGEELDLTVTEFWLIHAMATHPGQVKSRQQLMDAANLVLDDQTITAHIKRIRRKFASVDKDFSNIETVYGMGYRWLTRNQA